MYDYVADNSADVPAVVETYAGRVEGGDFEFTFDDSKDDSRYDLNTELDTLLANYKTTLVTSYTTDGNYPSTSGDVAPEPSESAAPSPTETATPTPSETATPEPSETTTPKPEVSIYDYVITKAEFAGDSLAIELEYTGNSTTPTAKLIVVSYNENGAIVGTPSMFAISGTTVEGLSYSKPDGANVIRVYIWNSVEDAKPLSQAKKIELK